MKRKYLLTLTFFAAMAGNLSALEILEPFSLGILTHFEVMYGRIFPENEKQQNYFEFVAGGGITENFSYLFSGSAASNFRSIENVGLNFIWQFISSSNFAGCLIPHAAFIAEEDQKLTAYYDLGAYLQLHLFALKVIQPYLGAGYSYTQNRKESDDYLWTIPLFCGIMAPIGETGINIFGQFTTEPCKGGKWDNIERYAAIGINYEIIENFELITEGGYEFTNRETRIIAGVHIDL